ncbi:unnamed protein product, partial [Staurois parvus]
KAGAERIKCFYDHREVKVEEFKRPDIEEGCKEQKEHPQRFLFYYIYHVGRRHAKLYQPAVIGIALQYNQITTECCSAEEKVPCFFERMTQVKKLTHYLEDKHKQKCRILADFPEKVFADLIRVQVAQKFGKAEFEDMNKDCCTGNSIECMFERMDATEHICEAKEKLSSKLEECCAKDILDRTPCIIALPNDESNLSKELKKYYEDDDVCEDYQKDKTHYLLHFAHDYSRSHQESAPQSCLRVAKGYEGLLEQCCASANHAECLKEAPKLLEAALTANEELTKQNCGGLEKLGLNDFYVMLAVKYFGKMPQVSAPTLADLTGRMTKIGVYCCGMADNKKQICAEEKLDILLGEMCEKEKTAVINDNVHKCCINSYADRRPCFMKMEPYPKYVAEKWDESQLHFSADLCEGSADDQLRKKITLLLEFMKMKPDCGSEKLKEVIEAFRKVCQKCCSADEHQSCFDSEVCNVNAVQCI